MSLAERLRKVREREGLSLDELATKADISKTYLWELEKDTAGDKKPSAAVLMQIAKALSTTIAELLELPIAQASDEPAVFPQSLKDFRERMAKLNTPLSDHDLRDLASMRFRGGQPRTADEWHQLYLTLDTIAARKRAK
jgi:transcriptional regulator with XRE-family HTH domain